MKVLLVGYTEKDWRDYAKKFVLSTHTAAVGKKEKKRKASYDCMMNEARSTWR